MIVDNDDMIVDFTTKVIEDEWENLTDKKNIAGLMFLKQDTSGLISGSEFPYKRVVENYNTFILKQNDNVENSDIWITKILKKYPYLVFPNENYVAETTVWSKISRDYNMLFVNKVIYIFEYREDGLTKSGRKLRLANPNGSIEKALIFLKNDISLKLNIKNMILYIGYGIYSRKQMKLLFSKIEKNHCLYFYFPWVL